MTRFARWAFLVASMMALYAVCYGQTPAEHCHGIVNRYHCGLPDERVPIPLLVTLPGAGLPAFPTAASPRVWPRPILAGWTESGTVMSFTGGTTMGTLTTGFVTDDSIERGDEDGLRRLGRRVNIGSTYFGRGCLPGQKYFYEFQVHEKVFEETWTCQKDRTLGLPRRRLTHIVTQKSEAGYTWEIRK